MCAYCSMANAVSLVHGPVAEVSVFFFDSFLFPSFFLCCKLVTYTFVLYLRTMELTSNVQSTLTTGAQASFVTFDGRTWKYVYLPPRLCILCFKSPHSLPLSLEPSFNPVLNGVSNKHH